MTAIRLDDEMDILPGNKTGAESDDQRCLVHIRTQVFFG